MPGHDLTQAQITRYRRHLILPEVGVEGQRRLLASRVLCVGVGGLGCPAALYLAAAGVGTLGLVDADVVSPSNLQRQVLFDTRQIGRPKVASAGERLRALNPDVRVVEHPTILRSDNAMDLIAAYDLVVDGSDNFPTRYCVNDACVLAERPNVYGSIFRFEGMVSVLAARSADGSRGPCYRCLHPQPPAPGSVPGCAEAGVMGVLPGVVGALQAAEAIKLLAGAGAPLIGRLLTFDALDMEFRTFAIRRDPACPVCGERPTITEPVDYEQFCGVPVVDPASQAETEREVSQAKDPILSVDLTPRPVELDDRGLPRDYPFLPDWEVTPRQVKAWLDGGEDFVFIDCRLPSEVAITRIDGARLVPLQQVGQHLDDLRRVDDRKIVVHCRSGGRSLQFAEILRKQGFDDVWSMAGGILLWNKDIKPGGPQY